MAEFCTPSHYGTVKELENTNVVDINAVYRDTPAVQRQSILSKFKPNRPSLTLSETSRF